MSGNSSLNESESSSLNEIYEPDPPEANNVDTLSALKILRSLTDHYEIIDEIGKGSFGIVYKCSALISHTTVAVKILKNLRRRSFTDRRAKKSLLFKAEKEYEICNLLKDSVNIIQAVDLFLHCGFPCLVFELLDQTLMEIIQRNGPMSINAVRPLAHQLLQALGALKDKDLIHGDLKPENIMLKDSPQTGFQLKLIDFGGAMNVSDCSSLLMFQTLHFRAPEVIICAPRSGKVDMWSAGCIIAEMLAGRRLYPGNTLQEQLYIINKCQGPIPGRILMRGFNTPRFYNRTSNGGFEMKADEFYKQLNMDDFDPYYTFQTDTLFEVLGFDESSSPEEKVQLLSLLEMMLHLDDDWRCIPEEGLEHEFFSMNENDVE